VGVALPGFEAVADHSASGREADYYATPPDAAALGLAQFRARLLMDRLDGTWGVEFGAGHGALVWPLASLGMHVFAVEIRPEAVAELRAGVVERGLDGQVVVVQLDFLTWEPPADVRLCWAFGNPPFGHARDQLAMRFIDRARALVGPTGPVGALLPASFNHTKAREAWLADNEPDELPLVERPKFMAQGGSFECSWFYWPATGRDPLDQPCGRLSRQRST
jgi:predicted RNA methylase